MNLKNLLLTCLLLACCAQTQAQVTFTFNTTARTSALGYTVGQNYSFQFVTGSSFGNNAESFFDNIQNLWEEESTGSDQLFTSITGSGLGGGFVRPTGSPTDPFSQLETDLEYLVAGSGQDAFFLRADTDAIGGDIGLTTNGGSSLLGSIFIRMDECGTTFAYPEFQVDPTAFFASKSGTYSPPNITTDLFVNHRRLTLNTVSDGSIQFDIESWTINAVPEPSTYAAAAGLLVGAAALARRRRA